MAITIKKVSTKRELKKFIRFNYRMYKGNPYSVHAQHLQQEEKRSIRIL